LIPVLVGALLPQGPLVAITDSTTTLVWGGGNIAPPVSSSSWNSFVVTMTARSWHVGTPEGADATPAQFSAVMSNLTGLYLLADFWGGSGSTGEVLGLDNVTLLSPVPEPASGLLLLAGLGALAVARRRPPTA